MNNLMASKNLVKHTLLFPHRTNSTGLMAVRKASTATKGRT